MPAKMPGVSYLKSSRTGHVRRWGPLHGERLFITARVGRIWAVIVPFQKRALLYFPVCLLVCLPVPTASLLFLVKIWVRSCLFVCLFVLFSASLLACLSLCLPVCPFLLRLCGSLSIYGFVVVSRLFLCLSVYMPVCLFSCPHCISVSRWDST